MPKKTAAEIIKAAHYARKKRDAWAAKLEEYKLQIAEHFDPEKSEDRITTTEGVVVRKVSRSFSVDVDRVEELRAALGSRYDEVVEQTQIYSLREDQIEGLLKKLGKNVTDFVKEHIGFKVKRTFQNLMKKNADELKVADADLVRSAEPYITVAETVKIEFVEPQP